MAEQTEEEKAKEAQAREEAIRLYAGPSGKVWSSDEVLEDFEIEGFGYGLCVVRRKIDRVRGSLDFTKTYPRFYFGFEEYR